MANKRWMIAVGATALSVAGYAATLTAAGASGGYVSLVWDDGARTKCFQHIGQTTEAILGRDPMEVSPFKGTGCDSLPKRPKTCAGGALWRTGAFLKDGTCPAWFVQSYNWRDKQRGKTPGWDFVADSASPGEPLLMTIVNNAAGDSDPCRQHEVNFNYNFPAISFKQVNGHTPKMGDFKDIVFSFKARMTNITHSVCKKLPRNLVKLSFIVRWPDDPSSAKPKYKWQSSVAVILFDGDAMLASLKTAPDGKLGAAKAIVFDNRCTVHRLYKNGTCMISLDGSARGLPQIGKDFRTYRISLTALMNDYRDKLLTTSKGETLDLNDAEIKTVQLISAVNGADMSFQLQDPQVLGVPR